MTRRRLLVPGAGGVLATGGLVLGLTALAVPAGADPSPSPSSPPSALSGTFSVDPNEVDSGKSVTVSGSCDNQLGVTATTVTVSFDGNAVGTGDVQGDNTWSVSTSAPTNSGTDDRSVTVTAACTFVLVSVPYGENKTLTVHPEATTPPSAHSPAVGAAASGKPGASITVHLSDFAPNDTVALTLNGTSVGSPIATDDGGAGDGSFTVPAIDPGNYSLVGTGGAAGTTNQPNTASAPFQVLGSGNADGPVPSSSPTPGSTATTGTSGTSGTTSTVRSRSTASPKLPATGVDSLVPGVLGGVFLVGGAGLVWAGRRRAGVSGPTV